MSLDVTDWPIDTIRPYPHNPRKIPRKAVEKLAASLRQFGVRQPLVVDEDGILIVGHTRLLAAQHLGLTTLPVHQVKGWSEAQKKAYRLADNRTAEETAWDYPILTAELETLFRDWDATDALGWDAHELDILLRADWSPHATETLPTTPVSPDPETVTYVLTAEQGAHVHAAITLAQALGRAVLAGDALTAIAQEWHAAHVSPRVPPK